MQKFCQKYMLQLGGEIHKTFTKNCEKLPSNYV